MPDLSIHLSTINRCRLFSGLDSGQIQSVLDCLGAQIVQHRTGELLGRAGQEASTLGVILCGQAQTTSTDIDGNHSVISQLYPGDIIAAAACCSSERRLPFDVECVWDCWVLVIDIQRLVRSCQRCCPMHTTLISNLLGIIADKSIGLAAKIDILGMRTIRQKVLAYLHQQARRAGREHFAIPLSRRQLAEYLAVNRSALSRELSALAQQGILRYRANNFWLRWPPGTSHPAK